ncbi:MAG: GNAT family N-acetyltransferase [Spirochaetaceae bacterium]|nr:GNAT family N-acetyltransferase [Spirochaetaceae bacterium]
METTTIEVFSPKDYDAARELWGRTPGMGLSEADSRERIEAFLARNPGLSFVARSADGRVVGTVLCGSDSRRGYLYHLAVDGEHRRRGLGQRLAAAGLAALKASGVEKCHLMVIKGNELGAAFWRNNGWKLREDIDLYSKSP